MDTSKLRITVSNMKNANSRAELERIKTTILENLSKLPPAPSVPFEKRPPALATVRLACSLLHVARPWAAQDVDLELLDASLPSAERLQLLCQTGHVHEPDCADVARVDANLFSMTLVTHFSR
jgi:hypothetical protein